MPRRDDDARIQWRRAAAGHEAGLPEGARWPNRVSHRPLQPPHCPGSDGCGQSPGPVHVRQTPTEEHHSDMPSPAFPSCRVILIGLIVLVAAPLAAGRTSDPDRALSAIAAYRAAGDRVAAADAASRWFAALPERERHSLGITDELERMSADLRSLGRFDEADVVTDHMLSIYRNTFGDVDPIVLTAFRRAATEASLDERYARAEALGRRALELLEADGADPEQRARFLGSVGHVMVFDGRAGDAIPVLEDALALRNPARGPPNRVRNGACAAVACPPDWLKRAFEFPMPCFTVEATSSGWISSKIRRPITSLGA
jgi:hypothetical protein